MSWGIPHLSAEAVAAYADGLLSPSATARARRHLDGCPDCRAAICEQDEARAVLRSLPDPAVPDTLLERLRNVPATTALPTRPVVLDPHGRPAFAAYGTDPMQSSALSTGGPTAGSRIRSLGLFAAAATVLTAGTVAASAATPDPRPAPQPAIAPAAVHAPQNGFQVSPARMLLPEVGGLGGR